MALSGSFHNYPVSQFGLYCEWTGSQSASGNYTDITLKVYAHIYDLYVSGATGNTGSINGVGFTYDTPAISDGTQSWHNILLTTKTQRVKHNADGTKTGVTISASWNYNGTYAGTSIRTITASTTVTLNTITTYTLTTSAGTGSTITVNRTGSGYGSITTLTNGARLYYGDTLKITFTPGTNYAIDEHKVGSSASDAVTFTSGNTKTVKGNVYVKSTATVLASKVGATNANIGSVSTITVTRYNSSYYHSLQYSFGGVNKYIKADGTTSQTEVKMSQTSVAFTVPDDFYAQIPNSKTGTCTITCRTYSSSSSSTVLGSATTCTFTVTAPSSVCAPTVTGTVIDTNSTTAALTGDSSTLIKYKSTAQCTITATANNSASISSKLIGGVAPTDNVRNIENISDSSIVFKATDSRGYSTSYTATPTIINYVQLTCNPIISRPIPTGDEIVMEISGDLYRGTFGEHSSYSNTLTLQYRYAEENNPPSSWITISSGVAYGTANYSSGSTPISLGNNFDYRKEYTFEVKACDGAGAYTLSTVTKTITVTQGIPVFDWGKDDFQFNVPIGIGTASDQVSSPLTINGAPVDYIESQGIMTTNPGTTSEATWIYRKWHSGIAECWCNKVFSGVNFSQWEAGSSWYTSGTITGSSLTYPTFNGSSIFVSTDTDSDPNTPELNPVLNTSLTSDRGAYGNAGALYIPVDSDSVRATNNVTGSFGISRGAQQASGITYKYIINYHAIGKWKTYDWETEGE